MGSTLMDSLVRRAVRDRIISPEQVAYADAHPGTFIGANGFLGRPCKYCCGPDKPRGNIALPLAEMQTDDVCRICYEQLTAAGDAP